MNQKKVGKFIAELRKEKSMTQQELAEKLFVDRTTISKWELGENTINTEMLLQIAVLFNVTINELIVGERQNKTNLNQINSVTVNILKKNKKIIKYLTYSCIFIVILITTFLTYYFINTYNSIMVYEIHGESNEFSIHNGLMIFSKDATYIQLGNIKSLSDEKIKSIKLSYNKDNKVIDLYKVNDTSYFYTSTYIDSKIGYNDLKYLISDMYLEVQFDDENTSQTKLQLIKLYSNNKLYNKSFETLEQNEINNINSEIPKYIKDNFTFNENTNSYVLEKKYDNKKIIQTYFFEMNVYIVEEIYKDYSERCTYSLPYDILYSKMNKNGIVENEFSYSITDKKCIMGECDDNTIDYFNNFYSELFEN